MNGDATIDSTHLTMTSIHGVSKERIEYGKAVPNCSNFGFGFWSILQAF